MLVGEKYSEIGLVSKNYENTTPLRGWGEITSAIIYNLANAKIDKVAKEFAKLDLDNRGDIQKAIKVIESNPQLGVVSDEMNRLDNGGIMVIWERYLTLQQATTLLGVEENKLEGTIQVQTGLIPIYTISQTGFKAMYMYQHILWMQEIERGKKVRAKRMKAWREKQREKMFEPKPSKTYDTFTPIARPSMESYQLSKNPRVHPVPPYPPRPACRPQPAKSRCYCLVQ